MDFDGALEGLYEPSAMLKQAAEDDGTKCDDTTCLAGQAKGDDADGFVRTEYYQSQRPGRKSFDRDRINASNSLSDLQVCTQP